MLVRSVMSFQCFMALRVCNVLLDNGQRAACAEFGPFLRRKNFTEITLSRRQSQTVLSGLSFIKAEPSAPHDRGRAVTLRSSLEMAGSSGL